MQKKATKELHTILLEYAGGITRTVKVKATSREQAETKALKFHPAATGIKRGS